MFRKHSSRSDIVPRLLLAAALSLALPLSAPGLAAAQPAPQTEEEAPDVPELQVDQAELDRLTGDYVLADPEGAEATIKQAIDDVVDDMFFLTRGYARRQLTEFTEPCPGFGIEFVDGDAHMACKDRNPVVSPFSGELGEHVTREGDRFALRQQVRRGKLVQVFAGDEGIRRDELVPQPDGGMLMRVRIESDQLPRDVEYELRYDPAGN